jgi:hypothetical protein
VVAGGVGVRPLVMAGRPLVQAVRPQFRDVGQHLFHLLTVGRVPVASIAGREFVGGGAVLGSASALFLGALASAQRGEVLGMQPGLLRPQGGGPIVEQRDLAVTVVGQREGLVVFRSWPKSP